MIDPFESIPNEIDPFVLNAEMPVSILSPSSISTYLRCPEQFRREYVLKEKRFAGAWGAAGTAFHKARHSALKWQLALHEPMSEADLRLAYDAGWGAMLRKEKFEWRESEPEEMKQLGWDMTLLYHQELGQTVVPIKIESGARGYVEGVPVPIYGRIDVETMEEIIDTKTGRQLKHKLPEEWFVQGMIYCFLTGKKMRWHVVSEKPAVTTSEALTIGPTPKVIASAERLCRQAYAGIIRHLRDYGRDDVWTGAGLATGACKYCSFKNRCAHVPT